MIRIRTALCLLLVTCNHHSVILRAQTVRGNEPELVAIDLPFVATNIAISANGHRVAVWDTPRSRTEFQSLAVVDLEQSKLVSQTFLSSPLLDVAIGDEVFTWDDHAISRLSIDQLDPLASFDSPGGARPFSSRGKPPRLRLVANQRLSLGPRMRLALPEITLIENYDHDVNSTEGWLDGRTGFGWISEGVLWDKDMSKPQLFVWPYEFQRSPHSFSNRSTGDFQPAIDTWHPFPSKLRAQPDRKVLKSVASPDIGATLGIIEEENAYHLASFRLDNGKMIANLRIASVDAKRANAERSGRYSASNGIRAGANGIVTGGGRFAMLLLGRLYAGSLETLHDSESSLPFHIVPRQSTFILHTDKPTSIHYEAVGATKFQLSSRILGSRDKPFAATSDTGEFTLSISESLDAVLGSSAGLAANLNQGRDIHNNQQRAEFYAGPSRSAFRRLFGREPNGIPLPVEVQVIAHGKDFETAMLRHDFLIEIPLLEFEDALDQKYPRARSPWKKPSLETDLTNYPVSAKPPTERGTAFDYLRSVWNTPSTEVSSEEFHMVAMKAKQEGDRRLHDRFVKRMSDKQWRIWTDKDGRKAEALLVQAFAGQVTLRTRKGIDVTFEETKLSDPDREFLNNEQELVTPNDSDDWREFVFTEVLRTVAQFHDVRNTLPPRVLADDTGQPRQSWRVLLLRELGYSELFALFHLNEPWNSAHNLSLVPFMPNILAVDPKLAEDAKTTLLTISSPLSAMPTTGMATIRNFGSEAASTVIFVEADVARAAQWTKPVDLELYEFAEPASVVRVRSKGVLIGLLSGKTLHLSEKTSPDEWRFAVNRGDGVRTMNESRR